MLVALALDPFKMRGAVLANPEERAISQPARQRDVRVSLLGFSLQDFNQRPLVPERANPRGPNGWLRTRHGASHGHISGHKRAIQVEIGPYAIQVLVQRQPLQYFAYYCCAVGGLGLFLT